MASSGLVLVLLLLLLVVVVVVVLVLRVGGAWRVLGRPN